MDAWDGSQALDAGEGQTGVRLMQISMKEKCRIHAKHLCFNKMAGQQTNQSVNQPASQPTNQPANQPAKQPTRGANMVNIFLMHFERNPYTV